MAKAFVTLALHDFRPFFFLRLLLRYLCQALRDGACQVAILSGADRTLCFSRQLYCGELKVTVDDEGTGVCEYIAYARSYTHGTQTIPATEFRTDNEKIDSRDSSLRSTIGEIVKIDVANIRKFAVAAY